MKRLVHFLALLPSLSSCNLPETAKTMDDVIENSAFDLKIAKEKDAGIAISGQADVTNKAK